MYSRYKKGKPESTTNETKNVLLQLSSIVTNADYESKQTNAQ